ncbi:MAG: LemA family protein [Chloroflexi bacterium]|nr:LemA family protein [Chloroflexota bacterium]
MPDPTTLIIIGIVLAAAIALITVYNGLVGKRVETQNAWSQIDVQLKRRHDLIPNLIETVKGYAGHEQETFERVTAARTQAMGANGVAAQAGAENGLTQALRGLFAVAEAYPDLKASQNFLALQEELTGTENRIGFARQHYNDVVGQYAMALQQFPSSLVAGAFGFKPAEFFELEAAEEAAIQAPPEVRF